MHTIALKEHYAAQALLDAPTTNQQFDLGLFQRSDKSSEDNSCFPASERHNGYGSPVLTHLFCRSSSWHPGLWLLPQPR
ncbi:MAG: hypothetical protein ACRDHZ_16810 [Ktedonobacteraceae bacterium]